MKNWHELTHFAGLDWAGDHHDVAVVDREGTVVAEFRIEHSAAGWTEFRKKMAAYPAWGIALETRSGAAVEELLQSEGPVFPVQPKAAARYRERSPLAARGKRLGNERPESELVRAKQNSRTWGDFVAAPRCTGIVSVPIRTIT